MMNRTLAALSVILFALPAQAEQTGVAPPAPITPPAAAAPAAPEQATAAAPVAALPPEFKAQFLSYDTDEKTLVMGQARRPITPAEAFEAMGRPDLVEKSRAASQRRVLMIIAGGVSLAAGIGTAVAAWAHMPNLNEPPCVGSYDYTNAGGAYNACASELKRRDIIGAVGIVGGVTLGALFGTLAFWSTPQVLSRDEAISAVAAHNAALLRRLREQQTKVQLRLVPQASPQGAGAVLALRF